MSLPMDSVWLLHHVHAFADGSEDVKLIGAFASLHEGEAAQALVATQPGFKENPEGFSLEECRLGIIYWQEGFVTEPAFAVGSSVEIVSVESCAKELPIEDQNRLFSLVGQERRVVEIDSYGFIWLSFNASENSADFCLFPGEVKLVANANDI
ncbi:MAG: hypothetical protein ABIG35_11890 [Pseudomonadota bacterium]